LGSFDLAPAAPEFECSKNPAEICEGSHVLGNCERGVKHDRENLSNAEHILPSIADVNRRFLQKSRRTWSSSGDWPLDDRHRPTIL